MFHISLSSLKIENIKREFATNLTKHLELQLIKKPTLFMMQMTRAY